MTTRAEIAALSKAAAAVREADERLAAAIRRAREHGAAWSQISDATGLSLSAVRWRVADAEHGYVAERKAAAVQRAEADERRRIEERYEAQAAAPRGTQHLTVSAAADALGMGRPTVYAWIEEGRIPLIRVGKRRLVRVDPETGRIPLAVRGTYTEANAEVDADT